MPYPSDVTSSAARLAAYTEWFTTQSGKSGTTATGFVPQAIT